MAAPALDFDCTAVFYANYQATEKVIINQGGTSSSKTFSIIQRLFLIAVSEPGTVITVTGESIPNLKKGAYRDAQTIYAANEALQHWVKFWNRSERIVYFRNGSLMEFISNTDEQTAKNGKRDYLFVNEANGVTWPIFFQMAIRTRRQIFLDYNPTAPFWSHDNLIGTDETTNELSATVRLIISDHRHNNFLTQDEHRKIEGIKNKDLWRVYARGFTGNLQGLVYPNWKQIPDDQFPKDAQLFGGLDFGYTNDPTAGVKIARVGDAIFLHELCYSPGITPANTKQIFYAEGFTDGTPIYCDHDPDIIAQLRRLNVMALPSRKGKGSIRAGIFKLYDYSVYYTASSKNLHEERTRYMWRLDPDTGQPTNTPEDNWNHLMDATRYGVYSHSFKG